MRVKAARRSRLDERGALGRREPDGSPQVQRRPHRDRPRRRAAADARADHGYPPGVDPGPAAQRGDGARDVARELGLVEGVGPARAVGERRVAGGGKDGHEAVPLVGAAVPRRAPQRRGRGS